MNKNETIIENVMLVLNIIFFYYLLFIGRNQYLYGMNYFMCIAFMLLNTMFIFFYGILKNNQETYKSNIKCGEDIRVINRNDFKEELQDFWIFDMKWIGIMIYDKNGKFIDIDFHEANQDEINMAKKWKTVFENAKKLDL